MEKAKPINLITLFFLKIKSLFDWKLFPTYEYLKSVKSINSDTQIVFTLKSFLTTIGAILGLFIGFHQLVILPKFDDHKDQIEKIESKSNENFNKINDKLIEISNGIGTINGNIEGINNRFKDLNQMQHQEGGSF